MILFYNSMSALGLILFASIVQLSIIAISVVAIVAILARAKVATLKNKCECKHDEPARDLNEGRTGDV